MDPVVERISNYSELNAPTLKEGNKKYAEQLTPDEIKQELLNIEPAFRIIRDQTQRPDQTYFGIENGFPQRQGDKKDLEAYLVLKTGQVLSGYKKWVEQAEENGSQLFSGDRKRLLYALGEGYEFFKGYYGFNEDDPWTNTAANIASKQSYKKQGFPSQSDVQSTMDNIRRIRTS